MPIYRSLSKANYSNEIHYHRPTRRAPGNVPYLVDNIWEWLRPQHMPSRRVSVYASPKKELALKYATATDLVCTVRFVDTANVVQIRDYPDARLHPDVKKLPRLVVRSLGQNWLDGSVDQKIQFGQLFIPLLNAKETNDVLAAPGMAELRVKLQQESTFWKDVSPVHEGDTLTDGELFFYAKDGYFLDPVEN